MPALKENGFLPDFADLSEETLARLSAVYICSPSNPEGAVATSADHEPRHNVRCFSAAHVPRKTTRLPSMTVQDPCARFGVFGFTSAVQLPCRTRIPAVARQDPRSWSVDCDAAATAVAERIARRSTNRRLTSAFRTPSRGGARHLRR